MSFLSLRTAIVDAIKAGVSIINTCEGHGGRFSIDELKRYSVRSPAVLVCNLDGKTRNEGGSKVSSRRWAVFIITRGISQKKRDAQVIVIVQEVLELIPNNRWGDTNAHIPQDIVDKNLFSADIDKLGVSLWVITWEQGYDIEKSTSGLDDFESLYGEWDMAPIDEQIDMESIVELEQ
jgi:hypothetical protein